MHYDLKLKQLKSISIIEGDFIYKLAITSHVWVYSFYVL